MLIRCGWLSFELQWTLFGRCAIKINNCCRINGISLVKFRFKCNLPLILISKNKNVNYKQAAVAQRFPMQLFQRNFFRAFDKNRIE